MTASRPTPVVISGVSRSGTSLMHAILASHAALAGLRETHLLRNYSANAAARTHLDRKPPAERAEILAHDRTVMREPDVLETLLERVRHGLPPRDWYRVFVEIASERSPGLRIVDKDPRYIDFLPWLDHEFPHADFVVCLRHPSGVLASKQEVEWASHRSPWTNAAVGSLQTASLVSSLAASPALATRTTLVGFESLVANTEPVLDSLLAGLAVEGATPTEAEWSVTAGTLMTDDERRWKQRTTQQVDASRANRSLGSTQLERLSSLQRRVCNMANDSHGTLSGDHLIKDLPRHQIALARSIGVPYRRAVLSGILKNSTDSSGIRPFRR